jgi:hypothetical protein
MDEKIKVFKLCLIKDDWAYFTTQELSEQWGHGWSNIPHDCNAEFPYSPNPQCIEDWDEDGRPKWEIKKIAFDANTDFPCDASALEINSGTIYPWLSRCNSFDSIYAGTALNDFIETIHNWGGEVYIPIKDCMLYYRNESPSIGELNKRMLEL